MPRNSASLTASRPAAASGERSLRFRAMACDAEIRIAGPSRQLDLPLLEAGADEVRRIEQKYSRYRAASIVSRINAAAGTGVAIEVDDETAGLLEFADRMHELSGGLFDITSGVLRGAWDFRSGRVPLQGEIAALLPKIGWDKVVRERRAVALPVAGMELDFGGFGKEYAADRVAALLLERGVQHGFVNLGGDIRVIGPRPDGGGWSLGIQHPRDPQATLGGIELAQGALATSGDYERFIDVGGRRYCHILNPKTGWPAAHWQSVSAVAPVCLAAGALTTIAMLKEGDAPAFLRAQHAAYLAIDAHGRTVRHGL